MKRFVHAAWYKSHYLLVAHVLLGAAVIALFFGTYALAQRADKAHQAICALDRDYQRRLHNAIEFRKKNPHGGLGFTPAEIDQQILFQRRTVEALRVADC